MKRITPPHTLLVIAGDFKTANVLNGFAARFRSMRQGIVPRPEAETVLQTDASARHLENPSSRLMRFMRFPRLPAAHPDQEALDLLAVFWGTDEMPGSCIPS